MLAGQSLERINSDNSRTPPPVDYALASVCRAPTRSIRLVIRIVPMTAWRELVEEDRPL
jgi:hypothetical protein